MTTTTKAVLSLVGAVIIGWAIYGAYQYPHVSYIGAPVAGNTFNTAKIAAIDWAPLTSTSTAVLNTDANDRTIIALKSACTGIGTSFKPNASAPLASLTFQAATSTSATASTTNNNLVFNTTIGTTTGFSQMSSSTLTLGGNFPNNIWASGTYLVMYTNATNTMACTSGVEYLPQ